MSDDFKQWRAKITYLPCHSGDGYGYGGGAVLVIGELAIPFGEGQMAARLAKETAKRWNDAMEKPDE